MSLGKLHEECGVFGVSVNVAEAAGITYNALLALQHRGQEGAGIAVAKENRILYHKDVGLVSEVFDSSVMKKMPESHVAIGHDRYSTTGNNTIENVQPFLTEFLTGRIATVHNGNIVNAKELKDALAEIGVQFDATSDSEVISQLIGYYIVEQKNTLKGVVKACNKLSGAYSLIILSGSGKLICVRDPSGYRPLCLGKNAHGYAVASESCALDSTNFKFVRDIKPGEVVVIEDGEITYSSVDITENKTGGLCIFEYVYFARDDSVIDGLSVYESRVNMGKALAKEYPVEADVVCGVPDSGLDAAVGYSLESGIPLATGFTKNRYIGRSFIYPTQSQRENAVRLKLNPLKFNLEGKRVVLVDDSIVRGTTSRQIVDAVRKAGAKEVHFRVSSPPFKYTCHYGTDIDSEDKLIANKMDLEGICEAIGADSLGYISIKGLKESCAKSEAGFCTKCFTGDSVKIHKNDLE